MACDHLCQLGHDMVQVEEALEMFQNCEAQVGFSGSAVSCRNQPKDNNTLSFALIKFVQIILLVLEHDKIFFPGKGVSSSSEPVQ